MNSLNTSLKNFNSVFFNTERELTGIHVLVKVVRVLGCLTNSRHGGVGSHAHSGVAWRPDNADTDAGEKKRAVTGANSRRICRHRNEGAVLSDLRKRKSVGGSV